MKMLTRGLEPLPTVRHAPSVTYNVESQIEKNADKFLKSVFLHVHPGTKFTRGSRPGQSGSASARATATHLRRGTRAEAGHFV